MLNFEASATKGCKNSPFSFSISVFQAAVTQETLNKFLFNLTLGSFNNTYRYSPVLVKSGSN
jgi:hypothetical protein